MSHSHETYCKVARGGKLEVMKKILPYTRKSYILPHLAVGLSNSTTKQQFYNRLLFKASPRCKQCTSDETNENSSVNVRAKGA